jgi:hypothetical protein
LRSSRGRLIKEDSMVVDVVGIVRDGYVCRERRREAMELEWVDRGFDLNTE